MRIILASASPRRKELLQKIFGHFEIIPAKGEEICTKQLPKEAAQELSAQKAAEIERRLFMDLDPVAGSSVNLSAQKDRIIGSAPAGPSAQEYLIIGADTVVAWNHKILGKPRGPKDAEETLGMLAGNTHQVYTGVALICRKNEKRWYTAFAECTNVTFYPMTEKEIQDYVNTKEPMDKAGSYGIQGIGGRFIERIEGDYDNVVGLPVARIYQMLKQHAELKTLFAPKRSAEKT